MVIGLEASLLCAILTTLPDNNIADASGNNFKTTSNICYTQTTIKYRVMMFGLDFS